MALFRQVSSCFPGSREILHEHILIQQESLPEETFHSELDRKPSLPSGPAGRHRLANSYIGNDSMHRELHLDVNGHKVSNALPSPLSMPHVNGFAGARCHVNITASADGADSQHQQLVASDSPAKRAKLIGLPQVPTPTLAQRSIYEATREALLADSDDCAQFSPLSPGGPDSSRRLAELFGLFRGNPLERTGTEGPDELLSQVAAEAASGEFDHLGDPADLHDLVSSDSALTDASGFGATYPPLSMPMAGNSGGAQPFRSAPMAPFGSSSAMDFRSGGPMMGFSSGGAASAPLPMPPALSCGLVPQSELQPMQQQASQQLPMERCMQRSSTTAPPIHTTQIVMAPRAASVPEVPQLPAHLATGPPSPARRNNLAGSTMFTTTRRSGLEVAAGGVAKRPGLKSKGSSVDLHVDSDAASQRSVGSDEDVSVAKKPKRASSGDRRPRRMTCNYCKTHVTPQWRCGPDGPRTLCNACGVRWGKGKLELPDGTKAVHPTQAAKAAKAAAEAAAAVGQPAAPAEL